MFTSCSKPRYLGLAALLATCLCVASLDAQPPGKKGKGPKGPRPSADAVTVRGTVRDFTTAPKGEVDGITLSDGTVVHWPPHLADRFGDSVAKGDRVRAVGFMETGPEGDTKLEVSSLTNLRTDKTVMNPDRPLPAGQGRADQAGGIEQRLQTLEDRIDQLTQEIRRLRTKK